MIINLINYLIYKEFIMNIKQLINILLSNVKTKAKFFILISVFASNLSMKASLAGSDFTDEQEMKLRSFIEKFMDKNVEPNKPFENWLQDLKNLLQGTPKFSQYCLAISDIEKSRNIADAGKNFEKFRELIPESLKNFFKERYSRAIVLKSLTERLKKRNR